tara:strand:- start:588 stop:1238 length:651 start_codon:yes stop_codon:yes gene_type:complete
MNRENICFISSCYFEDKGTYRLEYLLKKVIETGLIKKLNKLYIVNIGKKLDFSNIPIAEQYKEPIHIINYSRNTSLYELPTLELMRIYSKFNTNCNILYLQTKGISYDRNLDTVNDWIELMLYWNVEKHDNCLEFLNTTNIDTIGCNISTEPSPHYSGNFWWAKSTWINKLEKITKQEKALAEWWLMSQENGNHKCLYSSNVNHYNETFPRCKYVK